MTFGQKLKFARKNKKYTQKELAEAIGAKHNSVSNWENDQNKPDPDTIELICNVLDISANYLLGTNDPQTQLSPEAIQVALEYDKAELTKQNIVRLTLGFELKSKVTVLYEQKQDLAESVAEKDMTTEYK
jgi:transcriptional regulator with XRE-family HTH domain